MLRLNFTAYVVFVNRLPGPLAKTMQLRSSFFDAFTDIGSHQTKIFLEAKLKRAAADPAAAQLRSEVEGEGLKRKREEVELLELDLRCAKARSEIAKVQVESYLHCFELGAKVGVVFDDRARLQLRDMVGSLAPQHHHQVADRRKEICVRAFLLSKHVNPKTYEVKLGKIVARLKREKLRAAGASEALPTKTIEVNGQVVEAKLYFEEDAGLFDLGWEQLRSSEVPAV